jgi:hypothetical protein
MRPRVILDLCGGTGAWSKPYRDAGYRVKLITLPHYDVTKVNMDRERLTFLQQRLGSDITVPVSYIHGILAAPPCTVFSFARQTDTRPPFSLGLPAVESCERIIRHCMAFGHLKWWALENPVGHLRKFLGRPQFTFEHWWFDENSWAGKQTDLWGWFENPRRTVATMPEHLEDKDQHRNRVAWYTPPVPKEYEHLRLSRADVRAITPAPFAQAFFKANR